MFCGLLITISCVIKLTKSRGRGNSFEKAKPSSWLTHHHIHPFLPPITPPSPNQQCHHYTKYNSFKEIKYRNKNLFWFGHWKWLKSRLLKGISSHFINTSSSDVALSRYDPVNEINFLCLTIQMKVIWCTKWFYGHKIF